MKYYTRTTHNFNNETREWEYRNIWGDNISSSGETLGEHACSCNSWEPLWRIVEENRKYREDFNENIPDNLEQLVEKELDELVKLDIVRVQER